MTRVRIHNVAVSLDGFMAGPDQGAEHPLGVGGTELHEWVFATRTGGLMIGTSAGGSEGLDDDFLRRGDVGIGATVMGRNMFGPIRGPWDGAGGAWNGWWGDDPPYHHAVFVLTHHPRPPVPMQGGTTFHFVPDGIEVALSRASEAAGGQDVRIAGGASTIQQYLRAGLVDEFHVAVVPVFLGGGERLFDGLRDALQSYECVELASSQAVAHFRFSRAAE